MVPSHTPLWLGDHRRQLKGSATRLGTSPMELRRKPNAEGIAEGVNPVESLG